MGSRGAPPAVRVELCGFQPEAEIVGGAFQARLINNEAMTARFWGFRHVPRESSHDVAMSVGSTAEAVSARTDEAALQKQGSRLTPAGVSFLRRPPLHAC